MTNADLIERFYTSFAQGDLEGMLACYHDEIEFADSAFGTLKGAKARAIWTMLLSNKQTKIKISFDGIEANDTLGKAHWKAEYLFGRKQRKVVNDVTTSFSFKEGKIAQHTDSFSLWKWASQALGVPGVLLGWTPYMKKRIQVMTNQRPYSVMAKHN